MNCDVMLKCMTGMGDMLLDTLVGVVLARSRGCAMPNVYSRWISSERHYDWPKFIKSDLFVMETPAPATKSAKAFEQGVVLGPGHCGAHYLDSWVSHKHGMDLNTMIHNFLQVARSVKVKSSTPLPPDMRKRVAIHARRGDMIALTLTPREELEEMYRFVIKWLHEKGQYHVYLATDDPTWGREFTKALHAASIDTIFRETSPWDDLRNMMECKFIVRVTTLRGSRLSTLAAILSGVQLFEFTNPKTKGHTTLPKHASQLDEPWIRQGVLKKVTITLSA